MVSFVHLPAFGNHSCYCYLLNNSCVFAASCITSIDIVQSASETLKNLLATNLGYNFCKLYQTRCSENTRLLSYLHPFISASGKSKVCDHVNPYFAVACNST